MAERGVEVDHATLNRWVAKFSPLLAKEAHKRKHKAAASWRMDETYIKVRGKWTYYYRAVDKYGKTLDFMLSEHRNEAAATAFFTRAIGNNGFPDRVVIDVRRQGFWDQWRPKLRESLAHLVGLIMRRAGGDASVAFRVSFV